MRTPLYTARTLFTRSPGSPQQRGSTVVSAHIVDLPYSFARSPSCLGDFFVGVQLSVPLVVYLGEGRGGEGRGVLHC